MCRPKKPWIGGHYANRPGVASRKTCGAPECRRAALACAILAVVENSLDRVLHGAVSLLDVVQNAQLQTLGIRLILFA